MEPPNSIPLSPLEDEPHTPHIHLAQPGNIFRASSYSLHSLNHTPESSTGHDTSSKTYLLSDVPVAPTGLGKPTRKHIVNYLHLLALALATICCALAVVCVEDQFIAWSLGSRSQLVVVGFLLSVMSLCLGRVTQYFFALTEARFGRSKLQNFDAILQKQVFGDKLDIEWRLALALSLALPIVLSAGYKQFTDGATSWPVDAFEISNMTADYGLFVVPQISFVGKQTLYVNASLSFRVASGLPIGNDTRGNSDPHARGYGEEPPLPRRFTAVYGANTVVLNNRSTAMLDMPRHACLLLLQDSPHHGESLIVSANVRGTVAAWHNSQVNDTDFHSACNDGTFMRLAKENLGNHHAGYILAPRHMGDQSLFWLALRAEEKEEAYRCSLIAPYARRYQISRRNCAAMWSITRGGIQLSSGDCTDDELPPVEQYMFKEVTFHMAGSFLSVLGEALHNYAIELRNTSAWKDMSMTTFAASMSWSSLINYEGQGDRLDKTAEHVMRISEDAAGELGAIYTDFEEQASLTRPTMLRSPWLYVIFVVQPTIMLFIVIATIFLHSTPVTQGFGLVSILAGIDRETLDPLRGASLSGQLTQDVRLGISPVRQDGAGTALEYRLEAVAGGRQNGMLTRRMTYS